METLHIVDKNRLELFKEQYSDKHYSFACHVAIPRVFTTDLLYKLWMNFQKDENENYLDIPLTYIAELINAPICKEIGYDLYEFYPEIRAILQKELVKEDRFGWKRKKDLAQFIIAYVQFNAHKIPSIVVKEALKFEAEAILDPLGAIQRLMNVVQEEIKKDSPNQSGIQRVLKTIEYQSKTVPDGMTNNPWQSAQAFIDAMQLSKAGDINSATDIIKNYKDQISEGANSSDAISIPLPEEILQSLHLLDPENKESDKTKLKDLYVLLVGIDEYHPDSELSGRPLKTSINDCLVLEDYLERDIYQDSKNQLYIQKLIGEEATRENVIRAFQNFYDTKNEQSTFLFFFSGHVAYVDVPSELLYAYPKGFMKSYLCYDSRSGDTTGLFDIEINYLVKEVTKNTNIPFISLMDT